MPGRIDGLGKLDGGTVQHRIVNGPWVGVEQWMHDSGLRVVERPRIAVDHGPSGVSDQIAVVIRPITYDPGDHVIRDTLWRVVPSCDEDLDVVLPLYRTAIASPWNDHPVGVHHAIGQLITR